ncbi:uncharacterized protein N7496_004396 [Penicillium cataractarum]|uniref:PH domain-containing protein n=1 Tax=Penicillium cataractarum TaxID=2100454 RepID=A0A9W9VH33_9EURO|nr:uncharacterized protein N7496_004396 [Penicillium cataractarum]KAJ5381968.1 hypothetical protein N7496_004396 [Penicillium cataractarum]
MSKYTEDAPGQQVSSKSPPYHSSQDRTLVDRQRDNRDKTETNAHPAIAGVNATNQPNPSIARSMSRYRRNRPSAASATPPTPALPSRVKAQCAPALPSSAKPALGAEEERAREQHRQNAMAQLTGAPVPTQALPSQSAKAAREVQSGKALHKDPPATTSSRPVQSSRHKADAPPSSSDSNRKSLLQKVGLSKSKLSQDHTKESASSASSKPNYIGVGGGGIVPGTDAPVSAVNAGERLVLVKFGDASAQLPVTPFTQVQDLLQAATRQISRDINPDTFILIESFQQIGLERPLRQYERIRDVMNSWALDTDGSLIIVPPSSMEAIAQLEAQSVPTEKPTETTVYCYYSHRPRKWDKRYVTLRTDGQVTISKKENLKDATNICHLSDFDIYTPSAQSPAKEIKPPKKICVAIKSQEKSSMFLSTDNFVHFFSTNDRAVADKWHKAVQSWRSWYLVNKVGVANPVKAADETDRKASLVQSVTRTIPQPQGVSSDIPRLDRQNSEPEPTRRSVERARKEASVPRRKTTREHRPPPSSFPKTLAIDTNTSHHRHDRSPTEETLDSVFTSSGLLGRTYTQRQQAMHEREEREKRAKQDPFAAQGLVSGSPVYSPIAQPSSRTNTLTQADAAAHLGRTMSLNQGQKPLVDLTPVFVEPPQHTRKGRGVTVEPGRQLIDAATGPELTPGTVNVPPATAWRRPAAEVTSQSRYRSNTMRSGRQVSAQVQYPGASSVGASPTSPVGPFVANSLLAASSRNMASHQVQSRAPGGHGVATGDRNATRPLIDMSGENPFAEGSLLRKL